MFWMRNKEINFQYALLSRGLQLFSFPREISTWLTFTAAGILDDLYGMMLRLGVY